ncbi:MAG: hypothetical protein JNJ57_15215, partial [Saprospiraceae bacterium]|nr:hypothetical protein [Saprospiraceae bacterium]
MVYNFYLLIRQSIFLGCLLFFSSVSAQNAVTHIGLLGTENGLSQTTNAYIYQSKSFAWISSIDGLNRFDGRNNRIYKPGPASGTLHGGNIQSPFFEASNGDIWFSTDQAINVYRAESGKFEHFFIQSDRQTYVDETYRAICLEQDRFLWVHVDTLLFKFDIRRTSQQPLEPVHAIDGAQYAVQYDAQGHVIRLLSCYWGAAPGLYEYFYDSTGHLTQKNVWFDRPGNPVTALIQQIHIQADGSVWLAADCGLIEFHQGRYQIHRPKPAGGFNALIALADSMLLLGSIETGLLQFDLHRKQFQAPD